jgi:hypothetical protein
VTFVGSMSVYGVGKGAGFVLTTGATELIGIVDIV